MTMLTQIEIDGEKLDDMAGASHLSMLIIGGSETFPKTFANAIDRQGPPLLRRRAGRGRQRP